MLENVRQKNIFPLIEASIAPGTMVYSDEHGIYISLSEKGYGHKIVNHSQGEYARDEDGDGFHEIHVNTMEGFWSLLRSWLRPYRGISQESLPVYLGFFEFVHNAKQRGTRLWPFFCLGASLQIKDLQVADEIAWGWLCRRSNLDPT